MNVELAEKRNDLRNLRCKVVVLNHDAAIMNVGATDT